MSHFWALNVDVFTLLVTNNFRFSIDLKIQVHGSWFNFVHFIFWEDSNGILTVVNNKCRDWLQICQIINEEAGECVVSQLRYFAFYLKLHKQTLIHGGSRHNLEKSQLNIKYRDTPNRHYKVSQNNCKENWLTRKKSLDN